MNCGNFIPTRSLCHAYFLKYKCLKNLLSYLEYRLGWFYIKQQIRFKKLTSVFTYSYGLCFAKS